LINLVKEHDCYDGSEHDDGVSTQCSVHRASVEKY
jgi:hypothetical protein